MPSIGNLREFISKFVSLTDSEFSYFESFFESRSFNKKEKLVQEGDIENYLNFVVSGAARLYFMKEKEEVILGFALENEVLCCYESYLSGKPSNFFTESIEPMSVLSITHANLEKLFEFSPKFERLGRLYATEEFLKKAAFDYNRLRITTQERFIEFNRDHKDLLRRVPQKYLASYLDIKPETFSRMKHFTKGQL